MFEDAKLTFRTTINFKLSHRKTANSFLIDEMVILTFKEMHDVLMSCSNNAYFNHKSYYQR